MLSPLWLPPIQGAGHTISQGNAYLTSNLNSISLCRIQATTDPNHPKGAMQGGSEGGLQMKDSEEMEAGKKKLRAQQEDILLFPLQIQYPARINKLYDKT